MRAARSRVAAVLLCALAAPAALGDDRVWTRIAEDGLRDPKSPALQFLQQPAQALAPLAPDLPGVGNQVRWVKALELGQINPRTNIFPETKINFLDFDVMLNTDGSLPLVKFPHRPHTLWLDCANCHEHLFKSKGGANRYSMLAILEGEQCGLCHGAVAFPLTQCERCHSVPWDKVPPRISGPDAPKVLKK